MKSGRNVLTQSEVVIFVHRVYTESLRKGSGGRDLQVRGYEKLCI